jgi:cytochrome P450
MAYGTSSPGTSTATELEDLTDFRPTLNPEIVACPQPVYHRLQNECPVLETPVGVVISRHEDVVFALRHPEIFTSDMDAIHLGNDRPLIPLQINPPDHLKYRKLLDPLFAPREINKLESEVRGLANDLIDAFVDAGEVEYSEAFAIPLPCTVFLALMGLPQAELAHFLELKDNLIRPPGGFGAEEGFAVQRRTAVEIYDYFQRAIDERRAAPRDDLITRFTQAEVEGYRLSDEEILDICFLFIMAGLDTVTASLGCSMAYLAQHPEQRRELIADPGLVAGAVEELLRWEGVVPGAARYIAQDVELDGQPLKAGTPAHIIISAANVDPAEFPDPDVVDFHRADNRHLAFGGGIHRCLGSHLARLELRVSIEEWHRRIPEYEITPGDAPRYISGLRAVEYLPLSFRQLTSTAPSAR